MVKRGLCCKIMLYVAISMFLISVVVGYCGDGVEESGEQCDLGSSNGKGCLAPNGGNCIYCDDDCKEVLFSNPGCQVCGDGELDTGEQCEMKGTVNNIYCVQTKNECDGFKSMIRDGYGNCGDQCSCIFDEFSSSKCVKGKCNAECEVNGDCNDGKLTTVDSCNVDTCGCIFDPIQSCGNGIVDGPEDCDNGKENGVLCDYSGGPCIYCDEKCENILIDGICGDGVVDEGEECDGGIYNGVYCEIVENGECNFCSQNCEWVIVEGGFCGDGYLDSGEECDDGNENNMDGCNNNCIIETDICNTCGNGPFKVCDEQECLDLGSYEGECVFINKIFFDDCISCSEDGSCP